MDPPADSTSRLLDVLVAKIVETLDTDALAARIAAPVGVAVARGITLETLTDRVVEAISAKITQDEELLKNVSTVIINTLTQ
jgi:invasion protein IalB